MDQPLPLYDTEAAPDASHRIISPGGYETGRLDAETDDLKICFQTYLGDVVNPWYSKRYTAYIRRPTRCRPPTPSDCFGKRLAIFERGRTLHRVEFRPNNQIGPAESSPG